MVAHRFFRNRGPFTLRDIAQLGEAHLHTPLPKGWNEDSILEDIAPLHEGFPGQLGVLHNQKYSESLHGSKLSACVIHGDNIEKAPSHMVLFVSKTPYRAFAKIAAAFYPDALHHRWVPGPWETKERIHPKAKIGRNCILEQGVTIGSEAEIGDNTVIGAGTVIAERVVIGQQSQIGANCTISHAIIGNRVVIHPGTRIGQPGFGFHMDEQGHLSVPQLGCVRIEDDVDIGANVCIDRGTISDTFIGQGSRIDNLVQIAHNVKIGKGCIIISQVGISGSTEIGDYAIIAGQAGLTGHLKIGSRAQIGAQSGVMRDIPDGGVVMGSPAMPHKQYWQQLAAVNRMVKNRKQN